MQYKAPGAGPHIHLGIQADADNLPLAFVSGQNSLGISTKVEVPQYSQSHPDAHSSVRTDYVKLERVF